MSQIALLSALHSLFPLDLGVLKAKLDELTAKLHGWAHSLKEAERDLSNYTYEDSCPYDPYDELLEDHRRQWWERYWRGCEIRELRVAEIHDHMTAIHKDRDTLIKQIKSLEDEKELLVRRLSALG